MTPPPVSHTYHSSPHMKFNFWLGTYLEHTPGLESGDNGTLRMDLDNAPQPDLYLMIPADRGGQARIDEENYVEGAPEWIGEVSASSASYDLHAKLNAYRRNGVREYVVWRTFDSEIDYFIFRAGRFDRLPPGPDGIYRSELFPGLWLDPSAFLAGLHAGIANTVRQGVAATPEHAAFAARVKPPMLP